jgi:hypothetical protein
MKRDPLNRLREANPVPIAPAVDGADLFDRIVALPREAQPERRVRPARRVLVVAVAFAIGAIVASTAYAISNWVGSGPVKPPVTRHEYKAAQHQLTLPPGYSWPSLHIDPNSVTSRGAGGGHAVPAAQNAWECYWVDAIRLGDKRAQHAAQAQLNDLTTRHAVIKPDGAPEDWVPRHPPALPYTVWANDGGLQWFREGYKMAANGDASRLNASCRANRP